MKLCNYMIKHIFAGCTTNEIRLKTLEQNKSEGGLQICHNGVWGNVCSREVNQAISVVACRELGINATGNKKLGNRVPILS